MKYLRVYQIRYTFIFDYKYIYLTIIHARNRNLNDKVKKIDMTSFKYLNPKTLEDACRIISEFREKAFILAGGTDVIPQIKEGIVPPKICVDLSFIPELGYTKNVEKYIKIGTLTKVSDIEMSSEINQQIPMLIEAAKHLGSPQIRNAATVGGNICNASPCADLALALLALDAEVRLVSIDGERWIALDAFYIDNVIQEDVSQAMKATTLKKNELLAEIRIPLSPPRTEASFHKLRRTAVDIAIVNVAVKVRVNKDEKVSEAKIALGSVAPRPIRAKTAEQMLLGLKILEINKKILKNVSSQAALEVKPITDIRGTAKYRKVISEVLVKRGIENCLDRIVERQA
jgi:carbon-monoxide dehydrogenase medium subunit